jgi:hypothetical protein
VTCSSGQTCPVTTFWTCPVSSAFGAAATEGPTHAFVLPCMCRPARDLLGLLLPWAACAHVPGLAEFSRAMRAIDSSVTDRTVHKYVLLLCPGPRRATFCLCLRKSYCVRWAPRSKHVPPPPPPPRPRSRHCHSVVVNHQRIRAVHGRGGPHDHGPIRGGDPGSDPRNGDTPSFCFPAFSCPSNIGNRLSCSSFTHLSPHTRTYLHPAASLVFGCGAILGWGVTVVAERRSSTRSRLWTPRLSWGLMPPGCVRSAACTLPHFHWLVWVSAFSRGVK